MIKHFGIAFLILVGSYLAFTVFHQALPRPGDSGEIAYLFGLIVLIVAWRRLGPKERRRYFLILVLCLLALLDESGYGADIFGFKPYFSETYHREVRDLHNLIALGIELVQLKLIELNWRGDLFGQLMKLDFALLVGSLAFGATLRWGTPRDANHLWRTRAIWQTVLVMAGLGIFSAGVLLSLPRDPSKLWLFGLSQTRLLTLGVILGASLFPLLVMVLERRDKRNWQRLNKTVAGAFKGSGGRWIQSGLVLLLLLGIGYQMYVPFLTAPDQVTRHERILVAVSWALAEVTTLGLGIAAVRGGLQTPLIVQLRSGYVFLRAHPPFLYTAVAIGLILLAQLLDQRLIPLDDWVQTPNYFVDSWAEWTEEIFETTAGFEFAAAGFAMWSGSNAKPHRRIKRKS